MIKLRILSFAALAWLGVAVAPVAAQDFSAADRARVEARVAALDAVATSGDLSGAMDVVPPRLFRTIAERAGATEAQFRTAMRDMISQQLQGVTVVSYDMDLAAAPPTLTPDGSRTYLLIPTSIVMDVQGVGRVRSNTSTLSFKDEGDWHLMRIDDQTQVSLLREIWPEFANVDFPTGTTEMVQ